jgi:hypothetical protein
MQQVRLAVPTTTDQPYANRFFAAASKRSNLQDRKGRGAADPRFQEFASVHDPSPLTLLILQGLSIPKSADNARSQKRGLRPKKDELRTRR